MASVDATALNCSQCAWVFRGPSLDGQLHSQCCGCEKGDPFSFPPTGCDAPADSQCAIIFGPCTGVVGQTLSGAPFNMQQFAEAWADGYQLNSSRIDGKPDGTHPYGLDPRTAGWSLTQSHICEDNQPAACACGPDQYWDDGLEECVEVINLPNPPVTDWCPAGASWCLTPNNPPPPPPVDFCTNPCSLQVFPDGSQQCVCDPPVPSPLPRTARATVIPIAAKAGTPSPATRRPAVALKTILNPSLRLPVPRAFKYCACNDPDTDWEEALA